MSGDPEILACDAAGLSDEGPKKRPQREVDLFLLTHQFVASKRHPETLRREQQGSGMGMKNLGELFDAAIAFLVERWCLEPDHPECIPFRLVRKVRRRHHHCCKKPTPHQTLCLGHEAQK